ncbi:MAG: alpha/beta fold hydrolase [Myxococcales bacterium]|jgi:predicted alpha/beta-hydrolase family hydrolase|nr:alpha/beta fold hydrolase [Myxococcales bacterium]
MSVPKAFALAIGARGSVTAHAYAAREPVGVTLLLAHGAGAPHTHPFMVTVAERVAARGVDVVTFNFPYAEAGRKTPDPADVLEACFAAAIAAVRARSPEDVLVVGGKSMGGRIATMLVAGEARASRVAGLVALGYPLVPPSRAKAPRRGPRPVSRAEHLYQLRVPLLVVQGERDAFGGEAALAPVVARLPRGSRLFVVPSGDHSLTVTKRSGLSQDAVFDEVADEIVAFCKRFR